MFDTHAGDIFRGHCRVFFQEAAKVADKVRMGGGSCGKFGWELYFLWR